METYKKIFDKVLKQLMNCQLECEKCSKYHSEAYLIYTFVDYISFCPDCWTPSRGRIGTGDNTILLSTDYISEIDSIKSFRKYYLKSS